MNTSVTHILLADDDQDDCLFFYDVLDELSLHTKLTTVHDGEQLMKYLHTSDLPHVLFLDLNMPRKNGYTCLCEIKDHPDLKNLPVIIYSTSFSEDVADQLYRKGAHYYICKPSEYTQLKKVINQALILISRENNSQPSKEKFLLSNLNTILF